MTPKTDQSPDSSPLKSEERALGMNRDITRRDFLGSTALGVGTALLGAACPSELVRGSDAGSVPATSAVWTGYGGVGDYAVSDPRTNSLGQAAPSSAVPTPNAVDPKKSRRVMSRFMPRARSSDSSGLESCDWSVFAVIATPTQRG